MPVGKKLVLAALVLGTGAGSALFFRKDASQATPGQEAQEESPFRQRVERRVAADVDWARSATAGSTPAFRVPTAATVASAQPPEVADGQPTIQKSFNPVGALLEPIEDIPDDGSVDDARDIAGAAASFVDSTTVAHRIVDGDTLSKLAERYLGHGERYLEIFELNRDVLSSPDLLPIGAVLKIPSRGSAAPRSEPRGASAAPDGPLELVPVNHGQGSQPG